MHIVQYIQKITMPYPGVYRTLTSVYGLCAEIGFFFHALLTGKLFLRPDKGRFSAFLSRQKVISYPIKGANFTSIEEFRRWLESCGLDYVEGGWTFYLPPQEGLYNYFGFLKKDYPPGAGLKILKDFRSPDEAVYTRRGLNPAPGAALKRSLTPSPRGLLRVANYLYSHGLGMRVYDLTALEGGTVTLTCYVIQDVRGPAVQPNEYDSFMEAIKGLFERGEILTIHQHTNLMWDFRPPDCSGNLIIDSATGRPLFVDFQGFLLKDEDKILTRIANEVKEKTHFGGSRFYRGGGSYLYQAIPGLVVGKRDMGTRWNIFLEMMQEAGFSLMNRRVYDIGCNTGLILYNALSGGAQWGMGWDMPEVVKGAERVLLTLGATRFNLYGEKISEDTDFVSRIPERYRNEKDGVLFFLAVSDHIGFPDGIAELPWKYMFYEGHSRQGYEFTLERIRAVPWLNKTEILVRRSFADGDTPRREVILIKRSS